MTAKTQPGVWTTVPQRRFYDHASQNTSWAAEAMRETFLRIGFATLESSAPVALFFPPLKAHSPKQAAGNKDLHRNRYVEIGIVIRGEMTIWWEGVTTRCAMGSIFVIPPGIRYMPHVQPPEQTGGQTPIPHSVIWLAVHKSYAVAHRCTLEGNRHLLTEYYSFVDSSLATQARVIAQELADRAPYFETAIRGSLLCLFTGLSRAPAQPLSQFNAPPAAARDEKDAAAPDDFGERVRSYLLSHYHRPLTLPQVASAVGCSPSYLCRRFRELTGETPFHFLRDARIEAAKRLLLSEVPVARIAEMTGFDDPLYFSKVFARQVGASPQKFRARDKAKTTKTGEK